MELPSSRKVSRKMRAEERARLNEYSRRLADAGGAISILFPFEKEDFKELLAKACVEQSMPFEPSDDHGTGEVNSEAEA